MNVLWGALITAGVAGLGVVAMLRVRRRAPEGSYFADGDRAAGVFGVLATGFSVLLGFIVFLAFSSYDSSRSGAETEALVVGQLAETAHLLGPPAASALAGELICYGRSVAVREWAQSRDGTIGDSINPWALALFRTFTGVKPVTPKQQAAYQQWLAQTTTREQARHDRIHGAAGVIPATLWIVLFLIGAVIFGYMLFFADPAERARTQALLIGSVTTVITVTFLLLFALDSPFHSGVGGLRPVAMERTLHQLDNAMAALQIDVPIPCDATGLPTRR